MKHATQLIKDMIGRSWEDQAMKVIDNRKEFDKVLAAKHRQEKEDDRQRIIAQRKELARLKKSKEPYMLEE